MRTCLAILLCASVAGALAQVEVEPSRVPEGVTVRHVHATLGADGIARIDGASSAAMQQVPLLPVYENITNFSNSYHVNDQEFCDIIPVPAPAYIDEHVFAYFDGTGAAGDTCDVDFSFYNNLNNDSEIYEEGCSGAGMGLLFFAYTAVSIPVQSGIIWILTVSGLNFVTPGGFYIGSRYYNQTYPARADTGPMLMEGNNVGTPLGYYSNFPYSSYPFYSSPGDSQNCICRTSDGSSVWFGGYPMANYAYEFRGRYSYVGFLTGDYGVLGGHILPPMPTIWIRIFDHASARPIYVMTVLYDMLPSSGGAFFHLPFATAGPFDITFEKQHGYLSYTDLGATPDPWGFTTVGAYPLVAGDVNYDNTVDILDLGAVLVNFGKSGS
jgi:hypothetical protein